MSAAEAGSKLGRNAASPTEEDVMISIADCIGLCGLTEAEVLAIAEHEHIPEIAAAALAQYLLRQDKGAGKIREMIIDDIQQAQARGDREHVQTTLHVLHHFLRAHPEAIPKVP
jgi:DNA repair protein RadC